jgi:hypothetical protein
MQSHKDIFVYRGVALRQFSIACFLCFCLYSNAAQTDPVQYQASGTLSYFTGREASLAFSRHFQLSVSNADWEIRVSAEDVEHIDYFDVVHKGGAIYYYNSMGKISTNSGIANNGTVVVEVGDAPRENGNFADYVWLGLASSEYFRKSTNGAKIQPIWVGRDVKTVGANAQWKLSSNPPFLPTHVVYYRSSGNANSQLQPDWKGAELVVNSMTNLDELTMPREYTYTQFKQKLASTNFNDLEAQFQVRVSVDSAKKCGVEIAAPAMHGTTVVEDRRLAPLPANMAGVQFVTTNATLTEKPDPIAVEQHKRILAASRMTDGHSREGASTHSLIVRLVMLLLLILSVGVLVRFTLKQK